MKNIFGIMMLILWLYSINVDRWIRVIIFKGRIKRLEMEGRETDGLKDRKGVMEIGLMESGVRMIEYEFVSK